MACGCQAILLNEDVMMMTWNKAFAVLVGHSHPSVLVTVEAFQADLALAEHRWLIWMLGGNCRLKESALTLRGSPRRSQVRGRDSARPWTLHSLRTLRLGWTKKKYICTITVALYLSVVKVIASFCILYCILSTVHWWIKMNIKMFWLWHE